MYDTISGIIDHAWNSDLYGSEQQYIYYICGAVIVILLVVFIDLVYRIFGHFWNGKR